MPVYLGNIAAFEVTHNAISRTVAPVVESVQVQWSKEKNQVFYRGRMTTKLKFENRISGDYDWFKAIDDGANRCLKASLTTTLTCHEGTSYDLPDQVFSMNDGEWNEDDCSVEFTMKASDEYDCLLEYWNTKHNIQSGLSDKSARYYRGTLEFDNCTDFPVQPSPTTIPLSSSCLTDSQDYILYRFTSTQGDFVGGVDYEYIDKAAFVRETITVSPGSGAPPGDGWTLLGTGPADTYTRPPQVVWDESQFVDDGVNYSEGYSIIGYFLGTSEYLSFPNGKTLKDVLEDLITDCSGITAVKSKFYEINDTNTLTGTLTAYANAENKTENILIFDKSDIKRPTAQQSATRTEITLKALLDTLYNHHQVFWKIEDSGATLRIEHIEYWIDNESSGLDLSSNEFIKSIYKYNVNDIPHREVWQYGEDLSEDFSGLPIIYSKECTNGNDETYDINTVNNDIVSIYSNPDNYSDDGITLIACEFDSGNYYVLHATGVISTELQANGYMATSNFHDLFWKSYRYLPSGTMNDAAETFTEVRKTKEGDPFVYKNCCPDMATWDASNTIDTPVGTAGKVKAATYDVLLNKLTLTLLY